jgi:hypothetical protein
MTLDKDTLAAESPSAASEQYVWRAIGILIESNYGVIRQN